MKRGGFGADKLSLRKKVIGRRHFHKLKTSHDLYTLLWERPGCPILQQLSF